MSDAFKAQGLPPPIQVLKQARESRFQELYDKGYGDVEIAKLTNVSAGAVWHWRYTMENGVPNTRREPWLISAPICNNRRQARLTP